MVKTLITEKENTMKLYYSPGACSLSPHIVLREAVIDADLERVDLKKRKTESGVDYTAINPKGQVPALALDNGQTLTEGPAILQYLADQKPESGLAPRNGTFERYRLQEWLNFISSELHKHFGTLFEPAVPHEYKGIARDHISKRFDLVDRHLNSDGPFLMGNHFTVADAYLFVMTTWAELVKIDLGPWRNLNAYANGVAQRPKVQLALREEGLIT
jgi:glutathione S-transferase